MVTFRRAQIATLLQGEPRTWLRFVCASIEAEHPGSPLLALPPEARPDKARDWCDRAHANGLVTDADVLTFVFMMHELAPDFDQHPYVRSLLDRSEEPIAKRWARLFDPKDEILDRAFREAEEVGALPERAERAWHLERCAWVEEAFPLSYRDPRFARCFERIKVRRESALEGGRE